MSSCQVGNSKIDDKVISRHQYYFLWTYDTIHHKIATLLLQVLMHFGCYFQKDDSRNQAYLAVAPVLSVRFLGALVIVGRPQVSTVNMNILLIIYKKILYLVVLGKMLLHRVQ